jgi:hypothetical protein
MNGHHGLFIEILVFLTNEIDAEDEEIAKHLLTKKRTTD